MWTFKYRLVSHNASSLRNLSPQGALRKNRTGSTLATTANQKPASLATSVCALAVGVGVEERGEELSIRENWLIGQEHLAVALEVHQLLAE